jgi:glycerol uptake facilitator-like aquaporin
MSIQLVRLLHCDTPNLTAFPVPTWCLCACASCVTMCHAAAVHTCRMPILLLMGVHRLWCAAVTLAFLITKKVTLMRASAYWFCQLTGAILGSSFVYAVRTLSWLLQDHRLLQDHYVISTQRVLWSMTKARGNLLAVSMLQVDRTGWHASTGGTNRLLPGISQVPAAHPNRCGSGGCVFPDMRRSHVLTVCDNFTQASGWLMETLLTMTLVFVVFAATDSNRAKISTHLPVGACMQSGGCAEVRADGLPSSCSQHITPQPVDERWLVCRFLRLWLSAWQCSSVTW